MSSAKALNAKLSGSDVLNLLVMGPEGTEPMKDPDNMQVIDDLHAFLDAHPLVGNLFSLVSLVKRMNYVMHDNDPAHDRIPGNVEYVTAGDERFEVSGRSLIAQYLLLYQNGGGAGCIGCNVTVGPDPKAEALIFRVGKACRARNS